MLGLPKMILPRSCVAAILACRAVFAAPAASDPGTAIEISSANDANLVLRTLDGRASICAVLDRTVRTIGTSRAT